MQLLEHFKALSLHPKNATELKGLILKLAVEGKLTENWRIDNPTVENSSMLLDKIISYNTEQLKLKKRKLKKLSTEPEVDIDLPDNWIQTKNHILFSLAKGKNPKDLSETVKKFAYQDIEALDRGNVRRFSDDEKSPRCTDKDILVVCDGSRSGLVLEGKDGIVGSTLAIIETPPFIQGYVKLLFLQGYQKANSNMIGAAIPHLDTKTLLNSDIGLPPLEEQKAIVAVVNELFAEVEQLEELTKQRITLKKDFATSALQRLTQATDTTQEWNFLQQHFSSFFTEKANVKKLRETVLQLAVQGKLTTQWRAANPNRIVDNIEDNGKYDFGFSLKVPASWNVHPIGNIVNFQQGMQIEKSTRLKEPAEGALPILRIKNYHDGFKSDVEYIKIDKNSLIAEEDDIILTRTGESRGWVLTGHKGVFHNNTFRINYPKTHILKDYLKYFISSVSVQNFIKTNSGRTGQPDLSHKKFGPCPIAIPSIEEQQVIVEKVNAMMSLCDELEEQIGKSEEQIEQLMQSCLREVFEKKEVIND